MSNATYGLGASQSSEDIGAKFLLSHFTDKEIEFTECTRWQARWQASQWWRYQQNPVQHTVPTEPSN